MSGLELRPWVEVVSHDRHAKPALRRSVGRPARATTAWRGPGRLCKLPAGIAPIEAIFNRGPYPTAGGDSIVNATGWDAEEGYAVDWIPSQRLIADLSDLSHSLTIRSTGQSGHAFHRHYVDMADMWRMIQYHPMDWTAEQVHSDSEGTLALVPSAR